MHDFTLITTLAAAFTAAWVLGLVTQRLGLSPIVGYLLAGVVIGPYTPGFVGDVSLAPQLAELGVILLMFGVGLHFHISDLVAVKTVAIPGAIGQSLVATLGGAAIFAIFGWPLSAGLVVGMAMAVASTVVLLRVLLDRARLNSPAGHAAVGWLIVEDIITVLVLVLIPAIAGPPVTGQGVAPGAGTAQPWPLALLLALGKLAILVAVVVVAGSRVVPWVLVKVARLRSRELFTLTILVFSIAVATGSAAFFGVSAALGAFLAGMMVAQSPVSQQAGADALPLRDAFAVLFFVSVGMLFDPRFLLAHPGLVLAGLAIVLVAKPLAALAIVSLLGHPARTAITVAIGLAQIGEFSFILGELAERHGLVPPEARHLLVACALVSITLNPLLFRAIDPLETWLKARPRLWRMLNGRSEARALSGNAAAFREVRALEVPPSIVVGYGPVGRQVDRLLREAGRHTVIIDLNMDVITALLAQGRTAIYGDATRAELLEQAGAARAAHVILTTPAGAEREALITAARALNPSVRVIVRTRYLREQTQARQLGASGVVVDEVESAVELVRLVLAETGADAASISAGIDRVRHELVSDHRPWHA